MAALFALGVLAQEREWLSDGLSPQLRRACGRAAAVGLVLAVLVGVGISITDDPEKFLGGLHFEATLILLIEATLTLAMSLWVIEWFRRRGNRAGRWCLLSVERRSPPISFTYQSPSCSR